MKFMLIYLKDEKRWEELSEAERADLRAEASAYGDDLWDRKICIDGAVLHPSSTATTLRQREGRRVITDGPFAETKEVLGGFQVIECSGLDQALAVAEKFPLLRVGAAVEIRPVREHP